MRQVLIICSIAVLLFLVVSPVMGQDSDGDNINDSVDNCPNEYNPDQEDNDGDYIGNVCDNCLYHNNPDQVDIDRDGFGNVCDNCREASNSDQLDSNDDCPTPPYISDPSCGDVCTQDTDGDDAPDSSENCPNIPNPGQEDTYPPAGNNLGDACDCEGNFDCDQDCDGTDASLFKVDFGRSNFNNPCEIVDICNGDFDCDGDCDGTDASIFKEDFGRSPFGNPCPSCQSGEWCIYPQGILEFSMDAFERIRNIVAPEDETTPVAEFVGTHVEVQSEHWSYVLDNTGQQIFKPIDTYSHIQSSFSQDISPVLDEWMQQIVPQTTVEHAKQLALSTLGLNYFPNQGVPGADIFSARELIVSKSIVELDILKHFEGRTMVMFNTLLYDDLKVNGLETHLIPLPDSGQTIKVEPVSLPQRSYETMITFAPGGHVMRVESNVLTPEVHEVVESFNEGLMKEIILSRDYSSVPDLFFRTFFSPHESRFELSAYSWEGQDFHYLDPDMFFTCNPDRTRYDPTCNPYYQDYFLYQPCPDDTSVDIDYYITSAHYRYDFWYWWYYTGRKNGMRGNWNAETQTWEESDFIFLEHKDLSTYTLNCQTPNTPTLCFRGSRQETHCDGVTLNYDKGYFKLENRFYTDLEQSHISLIYTHGGMAWCPENDFYQFMPEFDKWVPLHLEGDLGLGVGNLRHLFLASCSSMNWNHGPKHGEIQNLFSDWMNGHIANGIRTICGTDGGYGGSHINGLRFFQFYNLNESISQAWFNMVLEESLDNVPVVVAYGGTENEAATTLFNGRFTKDRANTGWSIAAELITEHLTNLENHQACCLPEPDPDYSSHCIDVSVSECSAKGGIPQGIDSNCVQSCVESPICFE